MEIKVIKEDLSQVDCGGAYKEMAVSICVDKTLPLRRQRQALIYEVLSAYLDPIECQQAMMDDIANSIADALDELGGE